MGASRKGEGTSTFEKNAEAKGSHSKQVTGGYKRSQPATENYLTRNDIAERLQVSVKTVDRWIKSGELPASKLGGSVRVSESDLRVFIAKGRSDHGMQTFDQHVLDLYRANKISLQTARAAATNGADFETQLTLEGETNPPPSEDRDGVMVLDDEITERF